MKINISFLKKYIYDGLDYNLILNKLNYDGFESYLENDFIIVSVPNNKNNFNNFFSIFYKFIDEKKLFYNKIKNDFNFDFDINILNKKFCPLFCSILIKNINNKQETPFDIKNVLDKNDIKNVNFIVDSINYTTLITGQPMHAYDLKKIGKKLKIKKIKVKKKFNSINKTNIELEEGTFVIENLDKIISIPGLIGSYNSKVDYNTTNIFLESAFFDFKIIKNLKKKYSLNTLSSNIFSNIINYNLTKKSIFFFYNLIKKYNNIRSSNLFEKKNFNNLPKNKYIKLNFNNFNKLLGYKLKKVYIKKVIKNIGFNFKNYLNFLKIEIPYYRKDLLIENNIISEIIKFYNYNNVKELPINFNNINYNLSNKSNDYKLKNIKNFLTNNGFFETINYTFTKKKNELNIIKEKKIISIKNPISNKLNILRTSLIQGLLNNLKHNLNRKNNNLNFFEIGNVYYFKKKIKVKKYISGVISDINIYKNNFNYNYFNFYLMKNYISVILNQIYENNLYFFKKCKKSYLDDNISAGIYIKKKNIGNFGIIKKPLLELFSLKKKVLYFQIVLPKYLKKKEKKQFILNIYPSVKRDISLILNKNINYIKIKKFINNLNINIIKNINVIDFFNENIYVITIRLLYQSKFRTLLDKEVNFITFYIIEKLENKFDIKLKNF